MKVLFQKGKTVKMLAYILAITSSYVIFILKMGS